MNKKSFASGLVWNYISLIFMAAGGFCFSLLIGLFYDVETLGYFNTFYAIYMGLSQIAVFGCQNAMTKYISEEPENYIRAKTYLVLGVLIVLGVSVVSNLLLRMGILIFGKNSGITPVEVNALLFGVLIFAINKVILGYLNGLSRMTEHGIFQSFRSLFIAGFIVLFSVLHMEREYLVLTFLCAEILLLLVELPAVFKHGFKGVQISKENLCKVASFGYHILPANLVLELNSKADVLCLSFVTHNERLVGIYSFAILFAEGFYQLFVVIRRSINPEITHSFVNDTLKEFYERVNGVARRFGYLIAFVCGIILIFVYRVACIIMKGDSYIAGTWSLIVVIVAILINMRGILWGNLLSQVGKPKCEARVNITTIISNVLMNLIFINLFGMIGAAIGTAISYFVFTFVQKYYLKRELSI